MILPYPSVECVPIQLTLSKYIHAVRMCLVQKLYFLHKDIVFVREHTLSVVSQQPSEVLTKFNAEKLLAATIEAKEIMNVLKCQINIIIYMREAACQ